MNIKQFSAIFIATFFIVSLTGFTCDPDIDPSCPEGEYDCHGECIPDGQDCPDPTEPCPDDQVRCPDGSCADTLDECDPYEPQCGEEGGVCEPNYYSDDDAGAYNTGSYRLRQLMRGSNMVADNSNGDILSVNAYAEDLDVRYWQISEVDSDQRVVNVFESGWIVNRLFEFVDPDGYILEAQNPIIEVTPDEPGYSPLLQIWYVYVPENYIPNTIKSYATLEQAAADYYKTGIEVEPSEVVIVVEITDPGVGLHRINDIQADWQPQPLNVWKNRQSAHAWIGFLTSADDGFSVFVADQSDWALMPEPLPATLLQFQGCPGRIVYEERNEPGNTLYSPAVNRVYVDPMGADCGGLPRNANAIFDAIDSGTYQWSNWQSIGMVTVQFPY